MAGTKARRPTPRIVERWIRAGFGQGVGAAYKPFKFVRDIASGGLSSTVKSPVTGRIHHYVTRQEYEVHLLAEYSPSIIDIRERFALLPWDETQAIASKLGIKHPRYPSTATPTVITTDLLLTKKHADGIELIAVSAALTKHLTPQTLEKLLIERLYWNRRGVFWLLATEKNIPKLRAGNLRFFEMALNDDRASKSRIAPALFSHRFEANHAQGLCFSEILEKTSRDLGIDVQTGYALLGTAVWKRTSHIDIDAVELGHRAPVALAA
jgi:hypothetical protein